MRSEPTITRVHCPVPLAEDFTPCDPVELEPLATALRADQPTQGIAVFPRGTQVDDGRLDLCKQHIGPVGMKIVAESLQRNTHVTSLLLGANGIGNDGAAVLAELLEKNTSIETLYLGCNRIDERGLNPLVAALDSTDAVRGLWLKRNPLGDSGAEILAGFLARTQRLRTLDLVNTQLTVAGIQCLCDVLCDRNRTVERLYLGGNQLNAQHAIHLARMLRKNTTLKALLLNVNTIGDAGAVILAEALAQNTTLLDLGLASNAIGSEGAAALVRNIQKHSNLSRLDIGYCASTPILNGTTNHIGDDGASHFAELLRGNPVLMDLDLSHNGLTIRGVESMIDALEANRATAIQRIVFGVPLTAALIQRLRKLNVRATLGNHNSADATRDDVRAVKSVYRS